MAMNMAAACLACSCLLLLAMCLPAPALGSSGSRSRSERLQVGPHGTAYRRLLQYQRGNSAVGGNSTNGGYQPGTPPAIYTIPGAEESTKLTKKYVVAISCSVVAAILVVVLICWFVRSRQRSTTMCSSRQRQQVGTEEETPLPPSLSPSVKKTKLGDSRPRQLSSAMIKEVTCNFKDRLGEGAFGKVYLGNWQGEEIAGKQLTRKELNVSAEEFEREMGILMKVKHKNLVKFVAYCNNRDKFLCFGLSGGDRFLCFEYLSGGSLDKRLYAYKRNSRGTNQEARNGAPLDWKSRYYIIKEVCTGLHYLHAELDSEEKILHMDLKAGNILIRDKPGGGLDVKIADFGISRLFRADQAYEYITNQVIGMRTYLPPECFSRGKISVKVDIYSFGMFLLEMVTGWCANNPDEFSHRDDFIKKARDARSAGELLDRGLRPEECNMPEVWNCVQIALDCLQEDLGKRPDTADIAQRLRMP